VHRAGPAERNNGDVKKDFYTVSEAAKVLEVGQRRILEMLETKEIEGERDPISGRWKISKYAVHELAPEEPTDAEKPPATEEDTVELQVPEETRATKQTAPNEEPLLASHSTREASTVKSSEQSAGEAQERVGELQRLNERLQLEQQAEKAAWQEEKESLLAAAHRERQHAAALQEEVARLHTELRTIQERISELERSNDRLQAKEQAEKAAWQEEKESLLDAADRERRRAEGLQGEVKKLSAELETERRKPSWQRLLRK